VATRLGGKLGRGGYQVEQLTFCLSLLPHVMRERPDVIYFSDGSVGNVLWHWRKRTHRNFKLLFSNGGPISPPFPRWDHVQQVAPTHLEAALAAGQKSERQSLLPYGIRMDRELMVLSPQERQEIRTALRLPLNRPIVLSVGAVNTGHKRMDYVIRELAALPQPHPYLVMLGQQDEQTPSVRELADHLLGSDGYQIATVPQKEVERYYQAADVFVLASLGEGFGRVFLEALSHGLPCLAHDYDLTRYVLGDSGLLADFRQLGALTQLICQALENGYDAEERRKRHKACYERFSWDSLRTSYVSMLKQCAQGGDTA
jgi:1,2-diacylglycerol 3-alpha-glucosyltransferase